MDFLLFIANFGKRYAIAITDLLGIDQDPVVTGVPGTMPAVVGMTMFRNQLIPVVDLAMLYSGESENGKQMLIFNTPNKEGVLIEQVLHVTRSEFPDECIFMDVNDFDRQVLDPQPLTKEAHIELF
jgi:chemotaxis signal transduction protein